VKFGRVTFDIYKRTDKQTYRHRPTDTLFAILCLRTGGEVLTSEALRERRGILSDLALRHFKRKNNVRFHAFSSCLSKPNNVHR